MGKRIALGFDVLGGAVELLRVGGRYVLVSYDCEVSHESELVARAAFDAEACIEIVDGAS